MLRAIYPMKKFDSLSNKGQLDPQIKPFGTTQAPTSD